MLLIDSKRLTKDCATAQAALAANGLARRRTGATAVIEPLLPIIRELRARKHSWAAIATALAKQGVVQGINREPITARRLTALICAINNRVRRQEERSAGRAKRRDLVPVPQQAHTLYAYAGGRLVLRGGLSTHKHVFKSELKSG